MARNPENNEACDTLAKAISFMGRTSAPAQINLLRRALFAAYCALLEAPPPCPDDCLYAKMQRTQKCNCCARNRKLKDLYERG
jgi:hypothetical protein